MAEKSITPETPKESNAQSALKYSKEVAETGKTCTDKYVEIDIIPACR